MWHGCANHSCCSGVEYYAAIFGYDIRVLGIICSGGQTTYSKTLFGVGGCAIHHSLLGIRNRKACNNLQQVSTFIEFWSFEMNFKPPWLVFVDHFGVIIIISAQSHPFQTSGVIFFVMEALVTLQLVNKVELHATEVPCKVELYLNVGLWPLGELCNWWGNIWSKSSQYQSKFGYSLGLLKRHTPVYGLI